MRFEMRSRWGLRRVIHECKPLLRTYYVLCFAWCTGKTKMNKIRFLILQSSWSIGRCWCSNRYVIIKLGKVVIDVPVEFGRNKVNRQIQFDYRTWEIQMKNYSWVWKNKWGCTVSATMIEEGRRIASYPDGLVPEDNLVGLILKIRKRLGNSSHLILNVPDTVLSALHALTHSFPPQLFQVR